MWTLRDAEADKKPAMSPLCIWTCGDLTKREDVEKLMNGASGQILPTPR